MKFKAWAVIDAKGTVEPDGHDVEPSRYWANLVRKARKESKWPKYPTAKWVVRRVTVTVEP